MANYVDYDNAVELFTEVGNKRKTSESMQESLLKSTVGWTGKNLLKNTATSRTINGITFTVNDDGSVTVNGTASDYTAIIISTNIFKNYANIPLVCSAGNKSNSIYLRLWNRTDSTWYRGSTNLDDIYVTPSETDANKNIEYQFVMTSGATVNNIKVYPMLRDASITDDTYEPYHESVEEKIEQIYADNGVLGAKNLLLNNATSQTINGVTFTVNADKSVTVNGTATAHTVLDISNIGGSNGRQILPNGDYIISGCPNGGGDEVYQIRVQQKPDNLWDVRDFGNGAKFTISNDTKITVYIIIRNGQTVSNLVFKPMIRLASDPDDTYVPYAMTNRELTEEITRISPSLISTSMPSYVANSLPVRKKNITDDFYNGTLRAEIAAGNFTNVRPGDYIIGQSSGSTYYVACLDYRLGKGDQTNNANYPAYGTHHLGLMLFKHNGATRLWAGYGNADKSWRVPASDKGKCPWNAAADVDPTDSEAIGTNNTNITRQYNGANVSGYMGSFIRERIDEVILTEDFIADFGSANVLKYREINGNAIATDKPSGGQGNWNGCTSGWNWYDRFLNLPSEIELYGSRVFGSAYDTGCQCEQLPLFRNATIHDFFPRMDIWTKAIAGSSFAASRDSGGGADGSIASFARWACPLGCVR